MTAATDLLDGMLIFAEVIHCGSFTLAAEKTGHSTSYVSKEINQLEARLGVRLLHRTTRSLRLTPEGELYYQHCQQIIDTAQQAQDALSGGQQDPQGTLRVSCPVSFGLARLRPVLAMFTERYPKIQLELDLSDHKVDLVAEGFDVVIRASQQLADSSLICQRFLRSYALTLAAPSYLQAHGRPQTPSQLVNHQTIAYRYLKQPNQWFYTLANGEQQSIQLHSRVMTNSPEMELALCVAGQGITRLPRFNLRDELETGALVELFPDLPKQYIDVFLVYPSRKHISSKVRCFIDFVMQHLAED